MAKISAIILAAGAAKRFGRPKQLERFPNPDSPTMVERAVAIAMQTGVNEIIVVVGNQAEAVTQVLQDAVKNAPKPLNIVLNPQWADGQGLSVAAGVRALGANVAAAVFILADQPRLQPATVQTLLDAFEQWSEDEAAIIFPTYQGKRGHPTLFGRPFFAALQELKGDEGGRALFMANREALLSVAVDDPAILEDIDTLQDLERISKNIT